MIGVPKPERRAKAKARADRRAAKARQACIEAVWTRAGGRCEWVTDGVRCGAPLLRLSDFFRRVGQVDEYPRSRAQGGDPTNPEDCRLHCYDHHYGGPSHAHRVTPNWRTT
jgi:hypothetical protein